MKVICDHTTQNSLNTTNNTISWADKSSSTTHNPFLVQENCKRQEGELLQDTQKQMRTTCKNCSMHALRPHLLAHVTTYMCRLCLSCTSNSQITVIIHKSIQHLSSPETGVILDNRSRVPWSLRVKTYMYLTIKTWLCLTMNHKKHNSSILILRTTGLCQTKQRTMLSSYPNRDPPAVNEEDFMPQQFEFEGLVPEETYLLQRCQLRSVKQMNNQPVAMGLWEFRFQQGYYALSLRGIYLQ